MKTRLILASLVLGTLATGAASAAEPMVHHRKPVHHAVMKHRAPVRHHTAMRTTTAATYGAPNRRPLSSGDSPTVAREGKVVDPLAVPGSDAAIYNYSPNDRNSAYGY
ncbi:hypothetical protein [Aureimonas sp. AU4]|uniref:hypothetical protein n=1 Tax=Aureimonas sp. AU4 TaxID=1638163 RepID=UPI0007852114|nr:hypothetical protein [Aureimonas sp. AU4]